MLGLFKFQSHRLWWYTPNWKYISCMLINSKWQILKWMKKRKKKISIITGAACPIPYVINQMNFTLRKLLLFFLIQNWPNDIIVILSVFAKSYFNVNTSKKFELKSKVFSVRAFVSSFFFRVSFCNFYPFCNLIMCVMVPISKHLHLKFPSANLWMSMSFRNDAIMQLHFLHPKWWRIHLMFFF